MLCIEWACLVVEGQFWADWSNNAIFAGPDSLLDRAVKRYQSLTGRIPIRRFRSKQLRGTLTSSLTSFGFYPVQKMAGERRELASFNTSFADSLLTFKKRISQLYDIILREDTEIAQFHENVFSRLIVMELPFFAG